MKKLIIFVLVAILATILLGACGERPEVIDKEPVDVRHTEAYQGLVTTHVYKFNALKGEFQLVPDTHTVHYPERWEILWLFFYADNTKSQEWIECTEADYLAVKNYIDSGSCNGFRGLGGDQGE